MKRTAIISTFAIAAALMAVSCKDDDPVTPQVDPDAVSITDPAAIATTVTTGKKVTITLGDNAVIPSGTTVNAKSIIVKGGSVGGNLVLTAEKNVTIDGVTVTGTKTNGNAKISINTSSGDVTVKNTDFKTDETAYNGVEINLGGGTSKNVTVEKCTFSKMQNNGISIFGMTENGVINVKDCKFDLNADPTQNAVRLSNKTSAKNVTVNFTDCEYAYTGASTKPYWYGFVLFENYGETTPDADIFKTWTVNVNNVQKAGAKVTATNIDKKDESQFVCLCDDKGTPQIITDEAHFPTFSFK